MTDDLHTTLRAAVQARLALARAATPGPWWDRPVAAAEGYHTIRGGPGQFRGFDGSLPGDTRPVARIYPNPDYEGNFVTNHHADAAHIAANDPATVIRGCERDLRVLERHAPMDQWAGWDHLPATDPNHRRVIAACCAVCYQPGTELDDYGMEKAYPCDDIRDLAHAYGIEVK